METPSFEAVILPEDFESHRDAVVAILRKLAGRLDIRNADDRKAISVRRAVLDSPEFKALWERIKHRTTYRVAFDNEKLIADCIEAVRESPHSDRRGGHLLEGNNWMRPRSHLQCVKDCRCSLALGRNRPSG